jgi:transposase-like protein
MTLRDAIRSNLVTFPAQIPVFARQPAGQVQRKAVQLYFLRGWPLRSICRRLGLPKKIAQNLLSEWRCRAISAGLIQEIDASDADLPTPEAAVRASADRAAETESAPADRLIAAIREECAEIGFALTPERMQKIERIVRGGASAPDIAPYPAVPPPPAIIPRSLPANHSL